MAGMSKITTIMIKLLRKSEYLLFKMLFGFLRMTLIVFNDAYCLMYAYSRFGHKNSLRDIAVEKTNDLIVLGNGPSLKETLKERSSYFENKIISCVNAFVVSEYYEKLKPRYYLFFDSTYRDPKAFGGRLKQIKDIYNDLKNKTNWPLTIIMPDRARKWNWFIDLPQLNRFINIIYVNSLEVSCSNKLKHYLYKNNLAMPHIQNVLAAALYLGINMGFKKIFVFGADHSWLEDLFVRDDNVVFWDLPHFYLKDKTITVPLPLYKDAAESETFTMSEILLALSLTFKGHQEIRNYAKYMGVSIYNASKKSYIDAYERIKI